VHKIVAKYRTCVENAVNLIVVIAAIKLTHISPDHAAKWYLTPSILLAAALIPTLIKKQKPLKTLLPLNNAWLSISLLSVTCIIVLPLLFIALLLLRHWPIIEPAFPMPPASGQLANWIIFQFLYIAVFEEIFFRGYLQSNILKALGPQLTVTSDAPAKPDLNHWIAIIISSVAFTTAHMIIHSNPMAILIFLPSVIFGWLFAKTNSLIAPILFHGISNIAFCLMAKYLNFL
jgi:membrane protease YdiL (CAAX protease family)